MSLLLSNTRHNERSHTWRSSYFWNVRMAPSHFTTDGWAVGSYWCRNPTVVRFDNNRLVIMRCAHWRQDGSIICQKSKSFPLFTKLQFYLSKILYYKNRTSVIPGFVQKSMPSGPIHKVGTVHTSESAIKYSSQCLNRGVHTSDHVLARCDAFKYRQRIFSLTVSWRWKQWKSDLTYVVYATTAVFFFMAQQPLATQGLVIETSRSLSDTPHSVGLLCTSDQPVAETSTWQHTTLTRDRQPCPRRDSNPQLHQANGRRLTP